MKDYRILFLKSYIAAITPAENNLSYRLEDYPYVRIGNFCSAIFMIIKSNKYCRVQDSIII